MVQLRDDIRDNRTALDDFDAWSRGQGASDWGAMEEGGEGEAVESALPAAPSPALRVVGALERVRPLPRHSLLARIARTARSVLEHRLHDEPMALKAERAMLLFRSGALEAHISRALGTGLESCNLRTEGGLFSRATGNVDAGKQLRLSGLHSMGPRTVMETIVQGTSVHLMELRVRVIHSPAFLQVADFENGISVRNGRIALTAGTDLHSRHRVTLESIMGSEEDKHSLSNVVSTDFASSLAWGVATSHRMGKRLTLFSRYNSDDYSGRRVILQAVRKCGKNTISPICSLTSKGRLQAGITWRSNFLSKDAGNENFFQLKALCSQNGVYSLCVRAQFGEVEG